MYDCTVGQHDLITEKVNNLYTVSNMGWQWRIQESDDVYAHFKDNE